MTCKTKRLLPVALLICIATAGCHKTCVCTSYSGAEHEYTAAEVEEHNGGCSNMVMQADSRYYSHCEWR